MAAVKSSEGFLELLLPQYVANVDVPMQARCDDSGEKIEDYTYVTALHLACMKGFESCVKFLLVSQTEHAEMAVYTALNDGCCLTGWSNLFFFSFKFLLVAGASPAAVDVSGRTPIHFASEGNHLTCLSFLLGKRNAPRLTPEQVNISESSGVTALHLAVKRLREVLRHADRGWCTSICHDAGRLHSLADRTTCTSSQALAALTAGRYRATLRVWLLL